MSSGESEMLCWLFCSQFHQTVNWHLCEKQDSGYHPTIKSTFEFLTTVLKLLKMATGMRALLDTVVQALPQVKNAISF